LKQKAGLRLDTVALMRKGGESGSAAKLIIERVTAKDEHERMPQEAAALTTEQIAMLRTWIAAGAPGIANEAAEADPKMHWAFQSVQRPPHGERCLEQRAADLAVAGLDRELAECGQGLRPHALRDARGG
jgi:hypothetical protein